jgi:hypothetical protein
MNEKTVVITETDGKYRVENNGIPDFALIGILECIVFDMKSAKREASADETKTVNASASTGNQEVVQESNASELRTRIANAIRAIRSLGGQTPDFDSSKASEKELQAELEALTEQYKRLKNSKSTGKNSS